MKVLASFLLSAIIGYKYMQNNSSKDRYRLFIDELGTQSLKDIFSDYFCNSI